MSSIGRANADWLFLPGTTEPRIPSALEAKAAAWDEPGFKPDRIPEPVDSPRARTARAFRRQRKAHINVSVVVKGGSVEAFITGVEKVLRIRRLAGKA